MESSNDSELESLAIPNREQDDPTLKHERIDKDDPRAKQSNTESDDPIRVIP
jgi:hypothetical protein